MTLLEFVRKLQTPEGRLECAATYGECKERLIQADSDNFDLREEVKALKFERDRIDKTEELTKRLYTEKLVNEALNMEIEGLRKTHNEAVKVVENFADRLVSTAEAFGSSTEESAKEIRAEILDRIARYPADI